MIIFPFGAMVRRQRHIVTRFQDLHATSKARATAAMNAGTSDLAFRILRRQSVICDADDTHLFIDEVRWNALERRRHMFGILIPLTTIVAAVAVWIALPVR